MKTGGARQKIPLASPEFFFKELFDYIFASKKQDTASCR